MSRISRKQMKRNEMAETVGSVVEYTRDHTRTLLWAVVAVVAVLVLISVFFVWRGQRSAGATSALAAAMRVEDDEATARARFQKVVDRYPGTGAAAAARLYLAGYAAAESDGETARQLWREAAEAGSDTAIGQQARLNLWELDRSEGRHEELEREIRAMLDQEEAGLPKDQLLYQLGLTQEAAGADVEARDTYLRLVDEYPLSILRGSAEQRADRLGAGAAEEG